MKDYLETAKFIKLVHNWHDACNQRGLTAHTHVCYLNELHVFLTHGINFNCIPFQFPDRYIRGMMWQTFEALLNENTVVLLVEQFDVQRQSSFNTFK